MAYNKNGLKLMHNASAADGGDTPKRFYSYVTNDNKAAVEANGYFDGALDNGFGAGDIIIAILDDDGTPLVKIYHVTAGGADVAIRGLGASITALTDSSGGTASNTIPVIGASYAQADIRNAIASLAAKINELQAAVTV